MDYSLTFTSVILHQLLINSMTVSYNHTHGVEFLAVRSQSGSAPLLPPQFTRVPSLNQHPNLPIPSATWVSHHLERARDEQHPLLQSLTAMPANEGTISVLKDLRAFSWPWVSFDRALHGRNEVVWFLGAANRVIYVPPVIFSEGPQGQQGSKLSMAWLECFSPV